MTKQAVGRPWDPDAPRVPQGIAPALRQGPSPVDDGAAVAPAVKAAAWTPNREDFEALESAVGDLLGQAEQTDRRLADLRGWALRYSPGAGLGLRGLDDGDAGEAKALEMKATHIDRGGNLYMVKDLAAWGEVEDGDCAHGVKRFVFPGDEPAHLFCFSCSQKFPLEADRPKKKRRRRRAHEDDDRDGDNLFSEEVE